jgi:hypothetical protein
MMQVANFDLTEAEAQAAAQQEQHQSTVLPPPGPRLWNTLLAGQYQEMASKELSSMGRGRRARRRVNYAEDYRDDDGAVVRAAAPRSAGAAAAERRFGGGLGQDGEWRPDPTQAEDDTLPPRVEGSAVDGTLQVCGLDFAARMELVAFLTRFGLPLGEGFEWDWGMPLRPFLPCFLLVSSRMWLGVGARGFVMQYHGLTEARCWVHPAVLLSTAQRNQ